MNKVEIAVIEQPIVETADSQEFELSLFELDMVGGGNSVVVIN